MKARNSYLNGTESSQRVSVLQHIYQLILSKITGLFVQLGTQYVPFARLQFASGLRRAFLSVPSGSRLPGKLNKSCLGIFLGTLFGDFWYIKARKTKRE